MSPVAVGVPMWGDVGGGWDVWLPLYVAVSFAMVMAITGWRVNLRRTLLAVAGGTVWAWSVNRLGVIPAAAFAVVVAILAGAIVRHRGRATRAW